MASRPTKRRNPSHATTAQKKLTARDLDHAYTVWLELVEADEEGEYDGPETVMTSQGYADVWLDGDVTMYGQVVANVAD